jgi:hypothetical protein
MTTRPLFVRGDMMAEQPVPSKNGRSNVDGLGERIEARPWRHDQMGARLSQIVGGSYKAGETLASIARQPFGSHAVAQLLPKRTALSPQL